LKSRACRSGSTLRGGLPPHSPDAANAVLVRQERTRDDVEAAIKARGAHVYGDFLLPHLRPDMALLDCGCGTAAITLGLAEAVPEGQVVGVDLDQDNLWAARYSAALLGRGNLAWVVADARQLPFDNAAFGGVLCHSLLETLVDPREVVMELPLV
jgi:ubiquinone/menaquinone biosynthesis C-methylase UbiE